MPTLNRPDETTERATDDSLLIDQALETIRNHLGMPIGYISEFVDGRSVFRYVNAPGLEEMISVGDSNALEDVYCQHILEGRLPELIPDTAQEPVAAAMPITKAIPIGSHMSIPIKLPDGRPYGMFCCLSPEPNLSLNERDLDTMRMYADLAAKQIAKDVEASQDLHLKHDRIKTMLGTSNFKIAYQPIFDILTMKPSGYEALSRFETSPNRAPDIWFNEAEEVGLASELEVAAICRALEEVDLLTDGQYLSINASPSTLLSKLFHNALENVDLSRIMLEITEHAVIDDYETVTTALKDFRKNGLRIAVDDAGAGHSSLRHIVQLDPDFVKLDMSLTRNVDTDLSRQALVSALVFYSRATKARVIAEGIETASELETLKRLGVTRGQGYYLGKPAFDLASTATAADKRFAA